MRFYVPFSLHCITCTLTIIKEQSQLQQMCKRTANSCKLQKKKNEMEMELNQSSRGKKITKAEDKALS